MARIYQSGFETGSATGDWNVGSGCIVSSPKRSGNYSCRMYALAATSNYESHTFGLGTVDEAFYRAYFYFQSDQTYDTSFDTGQRIMSLNSGLNGFIASILMRQSGSNIALQLYNWVTGANVGAETVIPNAWNRWVRIELHLKIGNGTGVIEMKIDGGPTVGSSGLNTGTNNIDRAALHNGNGTANGDYWVDDVAINDIVYTSGYPNNASWPGDGHIVNYFPGSDRATGWSVVGSATHYGAVDDFDQSDYIVTTSKTQNITDSLGMAALNDALIPWGSYINAALFGMIAGGTATQARTVTFRVDDGTGYTADSSVISLATTNLLPFYPVLSTPMAGRYGLNGNVCFQYPYLSFWQPIYGDGGADEAVALQFRVPSPLYGAGTHIWLKKTGDPRDNLRYEIRYDAIDGPLLVGFDEPPGGIGTGGGPVNLYDYIEHPTVSENRIAYHVLRRTGSRDTSNYFEVGTGSGNAVPSQTPYIKGSGSWASATNDWCWLWYGRLSKSYLNSLRVSVIDLDSTTREMRVSSIWGSVDFIPPTTIIPPASLLLMRPRIFPRRKVV